MKIALDAMGGDNAPEATVLGALHALKADPAISQVILSGKKDQIEAILQREGQSENDRIAVAHAESVVTMDDPPTAALRAKKDSSITTAIDLLKKGECQAVISAGNTGASVAACVVKWRTLKGIDRPAIATVIPTPKGPFVLLDSGATVDVKPESLVQFAIMGKVYGETILGIDKPRIGLLNNGTEEGKGNEQSKAAFKLLSEVENINFIGNIEGRDLFEGRVDICVCDGFVGNIVLKVCESMAKGFGKMIKDNLQKNIKRKVGALLAKGAFNDVKKTTDYSETGGAPLLGCNGIFFKAHGSSNDFAIKNAILVTAKYIRAGANDKIIEGVETLKAHE